MDNVKKAEFWRWSESRWKNPEIPDWHGSLLTAGVDTVLPVHRRVILADGVPLYSSMRTGSNSPESGGQRHQLGDGLGPHQAGGHRLYSGHRIWTGQCAVLNEEYHRDHLPCPGGANIYGPSVRNILDMGGQDCKAIHCDERGAVTSFMMNDKVYWPAPAQA